LEDAYVRYMFRTSGAFASGSSRTRDHEKLVSDKRLVTVERSMLDAISAAV